MTDAKKIIGKIYIIDEKYRLPICIDKRADIYDIHGIHTIYNIALETNNNCRKYGIYANGLLVESCSKNVLKNKSNMVLID